MFCLATLSDKKGFMQSDTPWENDAIAYITKYYSWQITNARYLGHCPPSSTCGFVKSRGMKSTVYFSVSINATFSQYAPRALFTPTMCSTDVLKHYYNKYVIYTIIIVYERYHANRNSINYYKYHPLFINYSKVKFKKIFNHISMGIDNYNLIKLFVFLKIIVQ